MRCGRGPAFNQDPAPLPLTFPGKEAESQDKGRGEPRGAVLKQVVRDVRSKEVASVRGLKEGGRVRQDLGDVLGLLGTVGGVECG